MLAILSCKTRVQSIGKESESKLDQEWMWPTSSRSNPSLSFRRGISNAVTNALTHKSSQELFSVFPEWGQYRAVTRTSLNSQVLHPQAFATQPCIYQANNAVAAWLLLQLPCPLRPPYLSFLSLKCLVLLIHPLMFCLGEDCASLLTTWSHICNSTCHMGNWSEPWIPMQSCSTRVIVSGQFPGDKAHHERCIHLSPLPQLFFSFLHWYIVLREAPSAWASFPLYSVFKYPL